MTGPDRAEGTARCGCVIGGIHRYACGLVGHVDPPKPAEGTAVLSDEEREAVVEAIYRGRIRNCEETVENWPGEDTLLCRALRAESERFVRDAEPALTAILAARAALPGTADTDEVAALRAAVATYTSLWAEARSVLAHLADRLDEHAYTEFDAVLSDEPLDHYGESFAPRAADTGAREAVEALLRQRLYVALVEQRARDTAHYGEAPYAPITPEDVTRALALAATPDGHQHAAEES